MARELINSALPGGDPVGTAAELNASTARVTGHITGSPGVGRQWLASGFLTKDASGTARAVSALAGNYALELGDTNASVAAYSLIAFGLAGTSPIGYNRRAFIGCLYDGGGSGYGGAITFTTVNASNVAATALTITSDGHTRPGATNTFNLGAPSLAFANGYIQNAWTVTSDASMKKRGAALSEAEIRAGKRIAAELCWWQWLESVAKNGDKARNHFGPMAQDIARIFIEEGVEADYKKGNPSFRSDMLGWDEWAEVTEPVMGSRKIKVTQKAGSGWRIDPSQVAFFLIAAINADTEARLAALEQSQ